MDHKIIYKVEYDRVDTREACFCNERILHEKYMDEVFHDYHMVTNIIEEEKGSKWIITVIYDNGREEHITNISRVLKMLNNGQE